MKIIKSTRFQALVLLAIFGILNTYGILTDMIMTAAMTILGGHIGIRTLDRLGEKIGNK